MEHSFGDKHDTTLNFVRTVVFSFGIKSYGVARRLCFTFTVFLSEVQSLTAFGNTLSTQTLTVLGEDLLDFHDLSLKYKLTH